MADILAKLDQVTGFVRFETGDRAAASASISEEAKHEIERLRLVEQSVKMVMADVKEWAVDAGSTKTPRGRTLIAINQRLGNALKGKQANKIANTPEEADDG